MPSKSKLPNDMGLFVAWLRWMALDHYGYPEFEVPATHRKALEKIVWPEIGAKT